MASVFYIGDSTVTFNKITTYPQQGMSNALPLFLKDGITSHPFGYNGRSTKSFLDEGLFEPVRTGMIAGDFLLIQFGHNDEKADPARHTDPQTSFKENLSYFVNCARDVGAYPVLITSIARRLFDENGQFLPGSHGDYPAAVRELGIQLDVPVIDMTTITENFLAELSDEASKPLFVWPVDNTHLKFDGAVTMVRFLCQEIAKLGSPYTDILVPLESRIDTRGEI